MWAETPPYRIVDLGTLGGSESTARGINNRGQVVGSAKLPGDFTRHGVLWTVRGATLARTDLGVLHGDFSDTANLNDAGQICGRSSSGERNAMGNDQNHAVLFQVSDEGVVTRTDLGTFGGAESDAAGINAAGLIVGGGPTEPKGSDHSDRAGMFWVDANGAVQRQVIEPPGGSSQAYAVNDAGWIVGSSSSKQTYLTAATLWRPGADGKLRAIDLGTLGGTYSSASGINASGLIIGSSPVAQGGEEIHAVLWKVDENDHVTRQDLGTLGGAVSSANGINRAGVIVGSSTYEPGLKNPVYHGFVYTAADGMRDINGLVGGHPVARDIKIYGEGRSINDRGEIAASGIIDGHEHALLLEPANLAND